MSTFVDPLQSDGDSLNNSKSAADIRLILRSISENLAFRSLSKDQLKQVVGSMWRKRIGRDTCVVTEGQRSALCFIVSSGEFIIQRFNEKHDPMFKRGSPLRQEVIKR